MCRVLLLLLFLMAVAIVCLPWRINVALLLLAILLAKPVGGWLLRRAFMAPFRLKGAVLRDAAVEVHSVKPIPCPAGSTPEANVAWYQIDATITPSGTANTPFQLWEPDELVLCRPDAKPYLLDDDSQVGDVQAADVVGDSAAVGTTVEVADGAEAADDDGGKYAGPQRLRLLVSVDPAVEVARFRYYLEVFGEVRLPGTIDAA